MKIRCRCGGVVVDQTDFVPDKARLVADQDWFDVLAESDAGRGRDLLWAASRAMWQCPRCGVLFVDDHDGQVHAFAPVDDPPPAGLLRSYLRDRWKRPMAGSWDGGRPRRGAGAPGQLWWDGPPDDEGWEEFTDWAALERRYREVFTRLRDDGTLRSAFLRRDGEVIHSWPDDPGA